MKSYEDDNTIITFKRNTAMFRDKNTGKILGVLVYNPEIYKWRYIPSNEYKKNIGAINIYD